MTEQTQPDLETWKDFLGNWLKAEMVKVYPAKVLVVGVKGNVDTDGGVHLVYDVQYDGKKLFWEPNITTSAIIRKQFPKGPKEIVNKTLVFEKTLRYNPQIKKDVDALALTKIE